MNNKLIGALCVGALYFAAPHGAHAQAFGGGFVGGFAAGLNNSLSLGLELQQQQMQEQQFKQQAFLASPSGQCVMIRTCKLFERKAAPTQAAFAKVRTECWTATH
jgi:hypothetical protein